MTASTGSTWLLKDFQNLRRGLPPGGCLYGPEFSVGNSKFQVHLHPACNQWPDPGAIFLRLHTEGELSGARSLKIKATFRIPELDYSAVVEERGSVAGWCGGYGPKECSALNRGIAAFAFDELTVDVFVEILELQIQNSTTLRWPLGDFDDLRIQSFRQPYSMMPYKFEIHGPDQNGQDAPTFTFRLYLHPNIDATGNVTASFRAEKVSPNVHNLELQYQITFEELDVSDACVTLRGERRKFLEGEGLGGHRTNCPDLRKHSGPLTLRIKVDLLSCAAQEIKTPPIWSDFVSEDFRYLLINSAAAEVKGSAELMDDVSDFANACAWNINKLQKFLLGYGVPASNIVVVNFSGFGEQPHPRKLLEDFVKQPGKSAKLVVYFSGYARVDDGAWILRWIPYGHMYSADVTVTPLEFLDWHATANVQRIPFELIVEAAGAGAWCLAAKQVQLTGRVLAACAPGCVARAFSDGSPFTDWLVDGRASSWGNPFPGGPQVPWHYSAFGAAGPMVAGPMPMTRPKRAAHSKPLFSFLEESTRTCGSPKAETVSTSVPSPPPFQASSPLQDLTWSSRM